MAHQVQVNTDGIVLPDGREYDSGATVTLTDREFSQIRSSLFGGGSPALTDLGEVAGTSGDLSGLGDVIITDPQPHDVVKWDGTHWVNAQPDEDIDFGGGVGGGASFVSKVAEFSSNTVQHNLPPQPGVDPAYTPPWQFGELVQFDAEGGAGDPINFDYVSGERVLSNEFTIPDPPGPYACNITKAGLYFVLFTANWSIDTAAGDTATGTVPGTRRTAAVYTDQPAPWNNPFSPMVERDPLTGDYVTTSWMVAVLPPMLPVQVYFGLAHDADGTMTANAWTNIYRVL